MQAGLQAVQILITDMLGPLLFSSDQMVSSLSVERERTGGTQTVSSLKMSSVVSVLSSQY